MKYTENYLKPNRKKKNERLKTKADQFIKGSKLYVDPDLVKQSTYDRLGLEVEEKSSAIESAAKKYGLELQRYIWHQVKKIF